jgi:hypothetical protein
MPGGLIAAVAAVAAVASTVDAPVSDTGRRAAPIGDRPAVALTSPARSVDLGHNGPVDGLTWLPGGRLAVVTAKDAVLHVLEASGHRSARWELHGSALAVAHVGATAVVLLAPTHRAGTAWLALLDTRARDAPRLVRLPGIRAGQRPHASWPYGPWMPGLAAVRGGRLVVAGSGRIATVVPATGAVRVRHVPALRRSRALTTLPLRRGRTLALAGRDLSYLDVRSGRLRLVARGVGAVARWRGGVLSSGFWRAVAWDAHGRRVFSRPMRPNEFVAPAPDGRRLVLARYSGNGVEVRRTLNP